MLSPAWEFPEFLRIRRNSFAVAVREHGDANWHRPTGQSKKISGDLSDGKLRPGTEDRESEKVSGVRKISSEEVKPLNNPKNEIFRIKRNVGLREIRGCIIIGSLLVHVGRE